MLKIALPAGKSLEDWSLKLFEDSFLELERTGSKVLSREDMPGLYGNFVKPRRIPDLVFEGKYDVGITGMDVVLESGKRDQLEICAELPFGRSTYCKTKGVIFVEALDPIKNVSEIPPDAEIFSEYPRLTYVYFASRRMFGVKIVASPGSTEGEVPRNYRFGVCLSETGRSLRENNLRVLDTLFESSTVLIANKALAADALVGDSIRGLTRTLTGTFEARTKVLVSMNVPVEKKEVILKMLPSMRAPTITPLADPNFLSMSVVIPKSKVPIFSRILLKEGAEDIIVQPLLSVIPRW